jgi:hypothetical protein
MPDWVDPNWIEAAIRFFSLPEDASFWNLLNSPFLVAIVATIIGFRLNARLSNTQQVADTALEIALAAPQPDELDETEDVSELEENEHILAKRRAPPQSMAPPSIQDNEPPRDANSIEEEEASGASSALGSDGVEGGAPGTARDFRRGSEAVIESAKKFIQGKIDGDSDKRHQRTYDKISAGNPIARAIALKERRQISEQQSAALIDMFKIWNKYSKGLAAKNAVPCSVLHRLQRLWALIAPP